MGIENNTHEIEVQNQELQRANREQIEQANKEHEELGKVLDGLDTLDNEAELDEISGNEDISEQDDAASQLDNNDKIEDETSEQFETINNPVYNEVENNGFSINDVNQAVDAKEAYEAEIRDMSQDEYHDQKELDQRVEENGSEPNMTEPSVLGNDLHQGDVSNKETDNRSRLNEPEQDAVDMERSTEEISGNDEIDDSLSDVSTVDESNVQEVKFSELPDNVQESYRKYESDPENLENTEVDSETAEAAEEENPEGYHDIGEFNNELNDIYSDGSRSNQEKVDAAKECVDKLNHSDLSPEEKKQSVDAPSDARALKNPENSDWTERTDDNPWPPLNIDFPDKMGLDYDKDISPIGREEENMQLPDTGFRYGGESGYNYTCENSDGNVPTLDERSLPKEYVLEKDHEVHFDNGRYCDAIDAISGYEADPAASLDSINSMIDDINSERETDIQHLGADELEALSDKYQQLQDTEFADVRDELGTDDRDFTKYGVHGYAKPMEDASGDIICEGGADQFNTALPEYMLKRIGVEY